MASLPERVRETRRDWRAARGAVVLMDASGDAFVLREERRRRRVGRAFAMASATTGRVVARGTVAREPKTKAVGVVSGSVKKGSAGWRGVAGEDSGGACSWARRPQEKKEE